MSGEGATRENNNNTVARADTNRSGGSVEGQNTNTNTIPAQPQHESIISRARRLFSPTHAHSQPLGVSVCKIERGISTPSLGGKGTKRRASGSAVTRAPSPLTTNTPVSAVTEAGEGFVNLHHTRTPSPLTTTTTPLCATTEVGEGFVNPRASRTPSPLTTTSTPTIAEAEAAESLLLEDEEVRVTGEEESVGGVDSCSGSSAVARTATPPPPTTEGVHTDPSSLPTTKGVHTSTPLTPTTETVRTPTPPPTTATEGDVVLLSPSQYSASYPDTEGEEEEKEEEKGMSAFGHVQPLTPAGAHTDSAEVEVPEGEVVFAPPRTLVMSSSSVAGVCVVCVYVCVCVLVWVSACYVC